MQSPTPVSYPDETLTDVMEKFRVTEIGRLPVVCENPTLLLGVIWHSDLLAAYQRVVLEKPQSR